MTQGKEILMGLIGNLKEVLAPGPVTTSIMNSRQVVIAGAAVGHLEVVGFHAWVLVKVLFVEWVPVVIVFAFGYLPAVVPL